MQERIKIFICSLFGHEWVEVKVSTLTGEKKTYKKCVSCGKMELK